MNTTLIFIKSIPIVFLGFVEIIYILEISNPKTESSMELFLSLLGVMFLEKIYTFLFVRSILKDNRNRINLNRFSIK